MRWQSSTQTLPLSARRPWPSFGAVGDGAPLSGRVVPVYYATMDVPHYWTADQVQRLLELEWRDLDYAGEPATLLVRRSKTRRARTVRLHPELVQLFTNWSANRSPRDKVAAIGMRTALRHIADGIRWADLDQESPGTGKRRPGAHSLRHSAARHWLMVGRVPLNVFSAWLGHANVQVTLRIYLPIVGSDHGMENVP